MEAAMLHQQSAEAILKTLTLSVCTLDSPPGNPADASIDYRTTASINRIDRLNILNWRFLLAPQSKDLRVVHLLLLHS